MLMKLPKLVHSAVVSNLRQQTKLFAPLKNLPHATASASAYARRQVSSHYFLFSFFFFFKFIKSRNPESSSNQAKSMANLSETIAISFSDFPEDVQLSILSFLTPSEISAFACTSRRFCSLCQNDAKLWFSLCDRRWGSKTQIKKWGSGKITYKRLYKTLSELENLIGFWRRSGQSKNSGENSTPPLVFFQWGPSFITGSRVSPSKTGNYDVVKAPFLWICLSPKGENLNFLDPDSRVDIFDDLVNCELGVVENELIPVNINFMGKCHVVVEENLNFSYSKSPDGRKSGVMRVSSSGNLRGEEFGVVEDVSGSPGSLPDQFMSEMYQYFANRTSPGGDRWSRRQRRKEKERHGRMKWEPEHFVKIVNCSPTPSQPLQGLWKVVFFYYIQLCFVNILVCYGFLRLFTVLIFLILVLLTLHHILQV